MTYIKLKKIVKKQKASEQALKSATDQYNNIIYFGLDTYNEINYILKNNFKKVEPFKIQTMTPEEKVEELINKYILFTEKYADGWIESDLHAAKQCAIIAVDEILKVVSIYNDTQAEVTYWQEVKQEIEKLNN
jgi:hypothetical protein